MSLSITRPLSGRAVTLFLTPRPHNILHSSALLTALRKTYGEIEHFRNYRYNYHDVRPNLFVAIFREARDAQRLIRARNLRLTLEVGGGVHGEGVEGWDLREVDGEGREKEEEEGFEDVEDEAEHETRSEEPREKVRRKLRPEFGLGGEQREGGGWGAAWGTDGHGDDAARRRELDKEIEEAARFFERRDVEEESALENPKEADLHRQDSGTQDVTPIMGKDSTSAETSRGEKPHQVELAERGEVAQQSMGAGDALSILEDTGPALDHASIEGSTSMTKAPHRAAPDQARPGQSARPSPITKPTASSQPEKDALSILEDETWEAARSKIIPSEPQSRPPPASQLYNDALLSSLGDVTGSSRPLGRKKPIPPPSTSTPTTTNKHSTFTSILDSFYGPPSKSRRRFSTTPSHSQWPPPSTSLPPPRTLTFSIQAYPSQINFAEEIARHPYHGFYKASITSAAAKDLAQRVPIKALADFEGRREGTPSRAVGWMGERAREGMMDLRRVWEEGRREREREKEGGGKGRGR
ncbi:hypothetical protein KVT40_007355 [Elsinoe batatas]|uniref:Uncharacterized protein n=1 Tax=Elsinoe batatas TaxID=2601811 RepID=A0A8K0KX91_9PEZI|nr:hypothetical protein KVT40_007355 [Elsinoe batatas]